MKIQWKGESWGTWGPCSLPLSGLPEGLKRALAALPTHEYQDVTLINEVEMEAVISRFGGKLVHWLGSGRHMIVPAGIQASNINTNGCWQSTEIQATVWETVT